MRKLMLVGVVLAVASLASANLLTNPGFETGTADDADSWSEVNGVGRQDWGSYGGSSYSMHMWGDNGWWGYVEQGVAATPTLGHIVTFSIWATAQENFTSSGNEAYMKIEYKDAVGGNVLDSEQLDIYNGLIADPGNYNQYTVTHTVTVANVEEINVVFGSGGWQAGAPGDTRLLFDDASLTVAIPEPVSATLMLLGLGGLYVIRRRRS